ncbi:MAG: YeeE/YedE family protein [Cyclobacteriaceae bacterium]|nr:YeeE/YedE family protein [Cyclobacteriaceae bacterium]
MKVFKYILVGFVFGFGMWKLEAVSTFRIIEMFHFQSFHMFGIIMSGVSIGLIITRLFKTGKLKTVKGKEHKFSDKDHSWPRYILGGLIFGMGWALTGVCSGMMFLLLGSGYTVFAVFLGAALLGTYAYGYFRKWLPH